MGLQFGNSVKVFVTTNLDVDTSVNLSGFTPANTKQILIKADSLSVDQVKEYSYIDNSNILDNFASLETISKTNLPVGSMGFSTYLNSSDRGPFDIRLWNGLINTASYPSNKWTIDSISITGKFVRTDNSIKAIGILIISDNLIYVFHGVRVAGADISFDLSDLVSTSWKLNFEKFTVLSSSSVTKLGNVYNLSGQLSGSAEAIIEANYTYAPAKMLLAQVYDSADESIEGSLALTGLNLSLNNSLVYIENTSIDRTNIQSRFVYAGPMTVTGDMSFYTRNSGSFANTLINSITTNSTSETNNIYSFNIDIPYAKDQKLCEINIVYCTTNIKNAFTGILTSTISFKLLNSQYVDNCFIKFYT